MCSGPSCCRSGRPPRYVRAIEFRPGNARVVHHANLGVDRTRSSRQLDARDPEPGYVGGMVPRRALSRRPAARLDTRPGAARVARRHGLAARAGQRSRRAVAPAADRQARTRPGGGRLLSSPTHAPTRAPLGLRLGSETIDIPPASATTWSPTATCCQWTWSCWPFSRMRTTSRGAWRRTPRCPDGTVPRADRDRRLGLPLAGRLSLRARRSRCPRGRRSSMRYTYDNSAATCAIRTGRRRGSCGARTRRTRWGICGCRSCRAPTPSRAAERGFAARRARTISRRTRSCWDDPIIRCATMRWRSVSRGRALDEAIAEYRQSLGSIRRPRQRTTTSASPCRRAGGAPKRSRRFERRSESIPTTRRPTTILARWFSCAAGDEALSHFERAIALRPDSVDALTNLGLLLSAGSSGRCPHAVSRRAGHRRRQRPGAVGVGLDPGDRIGCVVARHRRGGCAGRARAAGPPGCRRIDALAAAYASAGRFEEAVAARSESRSQWQSASRTRRRSFDFASSSTNHGSRFDMSLIQPISDL